MVACKKSPSPVVTVSANTLSSVNVAQIVASKSGTEVATTSGAYLRHHIKHDRAPEREPMLPHERISRASSFGMTDVSAQPAAGYTLAYFDPLERGRLRQVVQHYRGDRVLLDPDDEALDGALGFTQREPRGSRVPTLTGLLLMGREPVLRQHVTTFELALQVLAQQAV